jgi:hypothetical protein
MGGRTIYRALSPKRAPLQTGTDTMAPFAKVAYKKINQPHTSYVIVRP